MVPEADEQTRREAEQLERQIRMMEARRGDTQARSRSALRRALIVIVVLSLAVWLWRGME